MAKASPSNGVPALGARDRCTLSRGEVADLAAQLARVALTLTEVADQLTEGVIEERDAWLIVPAVAHLRLGMDRVEAL